MNLRKKMQKRKNRHVRAYNISIVLYIRSNNKKSLNSVFRKLKKYCLIESYNNKFYLKLDYSIFNTNKNTVLSYIIKENLYFNVLGFNYKRNFIHLDFFRSNFLSWNEHSFYKFKNIILFFLILSNITLIYRTTVIFLNLNYMINLSMNVFIYKCLL